MGEESTIKLTEEKGTTDRQKRKTTTNRQKEAGPNHLSGWKKKEETMKGC